MKKQTTNSVMMIRPVAFRKNEQTEVNNYFQKGLKMSDKEVNAKAQEEFDNMVGKLREVGVDVIVIDDMKERNTPDSVFPNNWISFHENGYVGIYPMFAPNRRAERRMDILDRLEELGFVIENELDYTSAEEDGLFLEGTGAMVLDRENETAYCALSARADEDLFVEFCEDFGYFPVVFHAYQTTGNKRLPIYHTNVVMSIGKKIAVICAGCIDDTKEQKAVLDSLKQSDKEIVTISEDQVNNFAGNMLEVEGKDGSYMVMSQRAYNSLNEGQIKKIEKHCKIISVGLETIEECGGGSARCMMAEVFLPKNE